MTNNSNFDRTLIKKSQVPSYGEKELYDDYLKMKFTAKKIAFKIFYALDENNISIEELVERIQETKEKVSKILDGETNPDMLTLVKIEDFLSINIFDKEINSPYNTIYQLKVLTVRSKRELNNKFYNISENEAMDISLNTNEITSISSTVKKNRSSIEAVTCFKFEYIK